MSIKNKHIVITLAQTARLWGGGGDKTNYPVNRLLYIKKTRRELRENTARFSSFTAAVDYTFLNTKTS
ncbi:MAG: hypothetical protein LBC53_09525 [Spirochaetaceae bacterium]|jgi:hypothetical protein|nr:hypothetical protein [Spirochaetaceae bacterium]